MGGLREGGRRVAGGGGMPSRTGGRVCGRVAGGVGRVTRGSRDVA
jgi:hypothetical protein